MRGLQNKELPHNEKVSSTDIVLCRYRLDRLGDGRSDEMKYIGKLIVYGLLANALLFGIPYAIESAKASTPGIHSVAAENYGRIAKAKYEAMTTWEYGSECAVSGIILLGYLLFCGTIVAELKRHG